jgi:hypothetical protein
MNNKILVLFLFVVKLHGVNHEVFYFLMFHRELIAFNFGYTLLPYVLVVE